LRKSQGGWWLPEDAANAPVVTPDVWGTMLGKVVKGKDLQFRNDSRPARLLRSFRDLAAERGIQFTVVYLPQHPDFLRRSYTSMSLDRYQPWMSEFCRDQQIPYIDLNKNPDFEHADFADPVHLNARGAAKLSRLIARTVLATYAASTR
jgi:lysophospholipase L1-like esterase